MTEKIMACIHKESSYCSKSELNLFTVPPTQLFIDKHITVEYRPTTSLTGNGPLEFQVDRCDDFKDLSELNLYVNPFDMEHKEKTAVKFSILRVVML